MNKLTALLAVATVGLGSLSVHLLTELKSARTESASLQTRVAELERPRPPAPAAMPSAAAPGPVFTVVPAPPPPGNAARVAAPQARSADPNASVMPEFARRQMMDRSRKLMEDPEYRAAMRSQQKMMVAQQYPDLSVALNLSPDQADQLLELLADQQTRNMYERPPFRTDGTPDENEMREWQRQAEQRQRQNQEEMRALLGDAGMEQWKDYQGTMGARQQVRQLRSVLDSSGLTLQQDQVQPLVNAIAAEQRSLSGMRGTPVMAAGIASGAAISSVPGGVVPGVGFQQRGPNQISTDDRAVMMERSIERTEQYNQRLHDAATPYLSSQQLQRFDSMLKTQLDMQRAQVRMMRAQAEAEARGELPPASSNAMYTPSGSAVMQRLEPAAGR